MSMVAYLQQKCIFVFSEIIFVFNENISHLKKYIYVQYNIFVFNKKYLYSMKNI